ncbi:MAG: hypothetical protein LBT65_00335 [Synergistaceae bacterium]|jgi:hypothetical protein|nr:hypothetical protein [Synergistaceae bacterium]
MGHSGGTSIRSEIDQARTGCVESFEIVVTLDGHSQLKPEPHMVSPGNSQQ